MDVERDRALAAGDPDELCAQDAIGQGVADPAKPAIAVTVRRLDLDDVGAHLREEAAGGRALHRDRQLHYSHTLERLHLSLLSRPPRAGPTAWRLGSLRGWRRVHAE